MESRVTHTAHRIGDTIHDAAHRTRDVAQQVGQSVREGFRELRAESSAFEAKVESSVNRALEKAEAESRVLGAKISSKFSYLPFGPLSAALVWPTLAASGALLLYEYQGVELNRLRFARRSALLKPPELREGNTQEEPFERLYHLHQQTGESLITLIPSLYTFSLLVSPRWSFALGGGWLVSRIVYLYAHKLGMDASVEKPAYAFSYIAQMALLLGSAVNSARWSIGAALTWLGSLNEEPAVPATITMVQTNNGGVPIATTPAVRADLTTSRVAEP
jgi:hypothetical protein